MARTVTKKKNTGKSPGNAGKRGGNNSRKVVKVEYQGKAHEVELFCKLDSKGYKKEEIIEWYKTINLGRKLDEKASLYLKMAKGWSYHAPFAGHDGIQFAIGKTFRQNKDFLFPYYRDMLTSLAAGLTVEEIILNGLSKDNEPAGGGRHMSNHFAKPPIGVQNVSSCTGNHALHAAGVARAIKKYGGDEIAICSSGESAAAEGYYYEAIHVACNEKLPVVFVLQNNRFGISVPLHEVLPSLTVSDNFKGFKELKIIECDGRDPFDSMKAMKEAREYAASGKGPAMVHADCDRLESHSNSDKHENYRPEEEIREMKRRDPMLQLKHMILDKGYLSKEEIEKIEVENKKKMFEAADKAEEAPDADGNQYADYLLPEPAYSAEDASESEAGSGNEISLLEGINTALKQEFRANEHTYMWGQDIGKGGVFNVVKGMPEEFGKGRVFNAPIAEDSIVGTANGFCRYREDLRVVIEGAEFADYFWPAMEQLVECSHEYWRTKGQYSPNVTIRLASGGYIQGGLYHSQNLEATFTTLPGLRIVSPAFADDAVGLMRNSIRSKGVTLFLEPKFLYNFKQAKTPMPPDSHITPFGKGRIRREGSGVSIIAYGTGVHLSLLAAKELEEQDISVEVFDIRSLVPLDEEGIYKSVKKTNRVVVVHEDKIFGGFGGELSSLISKNCFNYLDAPVERVGSKYVPVGFAKDYELKTLPDKGAVIEAVKSVYEY